MGRTPLLERTRSGVRPTPAGRLFYVHALAALKHEQAAREGIRALGHEVSGTVALGLPSSTAAVLAVPLMKEVRARLPQVTLSVIEGLGSVLAADLARGALDCSVLFEGEPLPGFVQEPLVSERLHFVSMLPAARAALAGQTAITLAEAVRWPLILPPRANSVRELVDRETARRDLKCTVVGELSGVQTLRDAVEAGIGSTVMMAANAAALTRRKCAVVLPIRSPAIERKACLVQSEHFPATPAGKGLRELLPAVVGELVASGRWDGASLA